MNTSLFVLLYKEKERAYVYQYTSFLLLVIDNDNNDTCKTYPPSGDQNGNEFQ